MARWRYAGPGPQDDGQGGVVRPGEERDFDSEPDWGPWVGEQGPELATSGAGERVVSNSAPPGAVPPAPAPVSPAAASTEPPTGGSAPPADAGKGL